MPTGRIQHIAVAQQTSISSTLAAGVKITKSTYELLRLLEKRMFFMKHKRNLLFRVITNTTTIITIITTNTTNTTIIMVVVLLRSGSPLPGPSGFTPKKVTNKMKQNQISTRPLENHTKTKMKPYYFNKNNFSCSPGIFKFCNEANSSKSKTHLIWEVFGLFKPKTPKRCSDSF